MKKAFTIAVLIFSAFAAIGQDHLFRIHGGINFAAGAISTKKDPIGGSLWVNLYGTLGEKGANPAAKVETNVLPWAGTTRFGIGVEIPEIITIFYGKGATSRTPWFVKEIGGRPSFDFIEAGVHLGPKLKLRFQIDWRETFSLQNINNYQFSADYQVGKKSTLGVWGDRLIGFGTGYVYCPTKHLGIYLKVGTQPEPEKGLFDNLSVALGGQFNLNDLGIEKMREVGIHASY